MSSHRKQIVCNKKGKPVPPRDTTWQAGLKRAVTLLTAGTLVLPAGLCLYYMVDLPAAISGLSFIFGLLIFFGLLFMLFGVTIATVALILKRKSPPADEIKKYAMTNGWRAKCTIGRVRTKLRRGVTYYLCRIKYRDADYNYDRYFTSNWSATELRKGDAVDVYYLTDSNTGYYVDI